MLQNSPKKSKFPKFRLGEQPMGTLIFFGEFHGFTPKTPMYILIFLRSFFSIGVDRDFYWAWRKCLWVQFDIFVALFPSFFPSASGGDEIKPRRKTLTLLQRGLEVRGFFDTENAMQWTKKQHQKVVSF